MAFVREPAGMGAASGVLGSVVYVQTEAGTVMRSRPRPPKNRSEPQNAASSRLALAQALWDGLTQEEVRAWKDYALRLRQEDRKAGKSRVLAGNWIFRGLAAKYLQVHAGFEAPRLPPESRFVGDLLEVTVEEVSGGLRFTSDGSNRSGTITELLIQKLTNRNNETRPKSYVTLAFVTFEAGIPVELPVPCPGTWACAVKFVEAATGRQTDLVEIGRATLRFT